MRCPKCGTENGPDSRFCGVCGLPQPAPSRLAPTTKIPDDAPFAPPTRQVAPITPLAGVSYAPPSMPQNGGGLAPPQQAGLTTRPGGHSAPPRTGDHANVRPSGDYQQVRPSGLAPGRQSFDSITPTARQERTPNPNPSQQPGPRSLGQGSMASDPSMSFSAPHRPLGLIAIVLIIDLALAGAGAFLLAKGLSSPKPEKAESATDKKSELPRSAPAAAAAVTATPVAERAVVAAVPPAATAVPPMAAPTTAPTTTEATAAARTTKPRGAAPPPPAPPASTGPVTSPASSAGQSNPSATPVTAVPTTPVQPLQPPSTAAQIDTLANQSTMAFERCRGDQPIAGAITIAFNVQPDGTVANNTAVENTTGNAELAGCLARVVGGWRVSPFQGNTMSFVRPFNYP